MNRRDNDNRKQYPLGYIRKKSITGDDNIKKSSHEPDYSRIDKLPDHFIMGIFCPKDEIEVYKQTDTNGECELCHE
jgi:hypothetical protein